MDIFRGYVKTCGKVPQQKIIGNTELYKLDYVRLLNSDFGALLDENFLMIDIDDEVSSEKVLQIIESENIACDILKTSRGMHFYFLNNNLTTNKIAVLTACGIRIDLKLGCKNVVVPLKVDGVERKWIKQVDYIDTIPIWLTPAKHAKDLSKSKTRNQDLFNYILNLQADRYTKDQIGSILTIINKYILEDPLSKNELEVILRDEAFTKPNFYSTNEKGKTVFLHNVFANWMMSEYSLCKLDNNLYMYHDGEYSRAKDINSYILDHIDTLRKSERQEVVNYINDKIRDDKEQADARYINCANGIYNMKTRELTPHSRDILITNKIDTNYNPNASCDEVDAMMDRIACGDKQIVQLLYEMIGYGLYRRNELAKCFILVGDGSNGKSTLLQMIGNMVGKQNCSAVSLQDTQDRFKSAQVVGNLINLGDDIGDQYIDHNDNFKKMVAGNPVTFENKGKDPFIAEIYTKFIFSCNAIPRCKDTSYGFMRRLVLIPLLANFNTSDEYDPYIKDKVTTDEAAEYLLLKAIEGLARVIQNKKFSNCNASLNEIANYEIINNTVIGFVNEGGKFENENVDESYRRYCRWCNDNNLSPQSKIKVGRELKRRYKLEVEPTWVVDKKINIYKKKYPQP